MESISSNIEFIIQSQEKGTDYWHTLPLVNPFTHLPAAISYIDNDFSDSQREVYNYRILKKVTSYEIVFLSSDVFRNIPEYGTLYTIEEFSKLCKDGSIIDSDGMGIYAYEIKMSYVEAFPSQISLDILEKDFTHVVWFNK